MMKICHVSFGEIKHASVKEWLNKVPYFTRILEKMSERCEVASFHYGSTEEIILFQNVKYVFLKISFQERFLLNRLMASVRESKPDVIIIHGFHSSVSAYRFISTMKDFRIFIQHHGEKVFGLPKAFFQKFIDKNVCGYFFSSKEMGDEWVRAGLIQHSNRILEVLEVTSSFPVDRNQIVRHQKLNFIWIGRLDANKDPMTLIDGFISFLKIHPNANLYLIFNTNELLTEVKVRLDGFQNNIHLIGEIPHAEMPEWYAKCDFIISTSLFEAAGVSVLEGMSCGCIPILSDIPSFRKISSNGEVGLLFSQRSPEALSHALLKAVRLNVQDERAKLLDYFENHLSATAIAGQIIKFTIGEAQKERSSA